MSDLIERARLTDEEVHEAYSPIYPLDALTCRAGVAAVADAQFVKSLWAVVEWLGETEWGHYSPYFAEERLVDMLREAGIPNPQEVRT